MAQNAPIARPQKPEFATYEEERLYRKRRLAAACRLFAKFGFEEGVMGHISARDPERTDHYWANPFAYSFGTIKVSDLVLYNFKGEIVEGKTPYIHRGNTILHIPILATRPDVISAVHTHSIYGRTWSTLGRPVDPITAEAAVFYKRHALYDSFALGEGQNLADAVGDNRAIIMENHGIVTVGQTVDEAAYLFISLEKVCQAQLLAEAAGTPKLIGDAHAREIAEGFTPHRGWLNFQPLYDGIVKEQPDLLE
ncbi:class II aldolase/adducin family protein [Saccharibacillus sp. CPCC 101409]|uniref:class II aldolase/adducin family protein n=1 Tax=Saccharibacillus sp. CPCC 101409 TaxID=3058041 RepID=UPI00267281FD|nr:class II aldolase/adducin family protein [Saccharibacillus sp. CPCC 101409]MDO3409429.1 class II aldolase/adducin family protein [Saccharibacillus sp. CPCC 101409]